MNTTINEAKELATMLADMRAEGQHLLSELYEASRGMPYEEAYRVIDDYNNAIDSMVEDINDFLRPRRQAGFLAKW